MPNLKPAAAYLRCSTTAQKDDSPAQQLAAIEVRAKELGFRIVKVYTDAGKSGTSFDKRPAFQEMLRDVETSRAKYCAVFCYDESRWGRPINAEENVFFRVLFERHHVQIELVKTMLDRSSPFSPVTRAVEAVLASEDSKKKAEVVKRGQRANAEQGRSSGGIAPYGFARQAFDRITGAPTRLLAPGIHCSPNEKVIFVPIPEEARVVERIFHLTQQGLGFGSIANLLNSEGIPSPARGRGKGWSRITVMFIVNNPTYTGSRIYGKVSHDFGRRHFVRTDPSTWTVRPNAHAAIIPQEMFDAIQARRTVGVKRNGHTSRPYLLSGLIRCEYCKFGWQGVTRSVGPKRYFYYKCTGNHLHGKSQCPAWSVPKYEIEQFVVNTVLNRISDSNYLHRVEELVARRLGDRDDQDARLASLQQRLALNQKAVRNLMTLLSQGSDLEEVQSSLAVLQRERKQLEVDIAKCQSDARGAANSIAVVKRIKELTREFSKTFANAPIHLQKSLLRKFVDHVSANPTTKTISVVLRRVPAIDNVGASIESSGSDQYHMVCTR